MQGINKREKSEMPATTAHWPWLSVPLRWPESIFLYQLLLDQLTWQTQPLQAGLSTCIVSDEPQAPATRRVWWERLSSPTSPLGPAQARRTGIWREGLAPGSSHFLCSLQQAGPLLLSKLHRELTSIKTSLGCPLWSYGALWMSPLRMSGTGSQ